MLGGGFGKGMGVKENQALVTVAFLVRSTGITHACQESSDTEMPGQLYGCCNYVPGPTHMVLPWDTRK